jgi:YD repeat-containing protein
MKKSNVTSPRRLLAAFLQATRHLAPMATAIACGSAYAEIEPPPEVAVRDEVGVDVISGTPTFSMQDLKIGTGESVLTHSIASYASYFWGFTDNFHLSAGLSGSNEKVHRNVRLGHKSQAFLVESGDLFGFATYKPLKDDGATLVEHSDNSYTYTGPDGTVARIGEVVDGKTYPRGGKIIYPSGFEVTLHRRNNRIQSVTTNTGLQLKYFYRSNALPSNPTPDDRSKFYHPSRIVAVNNAVEYCSPAADSCSFSQQWPSVTYTWPSHSEIHSSTGSASGVFKITDAEGGVTLYRHKSYSMQISGGSPYEPRISEVTSKTGAKSYYDYEHAYVCTMVGTWRCNIQKSNAVSQVKTNGATYTYGYDVFPYGFAGTSDGPAGRHYVQMDSKYMFPRLTTVSTPESVRASFYDNDANALESVVDQGKKFTFTYDTRGNLTHRSQHPYPDTSTGTVLTATAGYASSCTTTNRKWCNKPLWTKDPKGSQTDYTYHDPSGKVATVTLPPDNSGVRAQTRYTYQQHYAWYKTSSTSIVRASTPVWLLAEERTCRQGDTVGDSCANPQAEVITTYEYGSGSSSEANNLWLKGVVVNAYNPVTGTREDLRTCYQYDNYGNVISETTPNAALTSCP